MLVNGKPFQLKCHEISCAELSENVTVFKKCVFLKNSSKKVGSTCLEKVHVLNNCLLSGKSSSEKAAVLKKYLSSRNS